MNLPGRLVSAVILALSCPAAAFAHDTAPAPSPPPVAASHGGDWLDAVPLAGWNAPGAPVPRPPPPSGDLPTVERCAGRLRDPQTPEEAEVARAGWSLVTAPVRGGSTGVILGISSVDGMCRPNGYQALVFSEGRFAGTLSPRPMDSRTDGAVDLPAVGADGTVDATFRRYGADDALCCPSRISRLRFRIEARPSGPVAVPGEVQTASTAVPAARPAPPPPPTRPATPATPPTPGQLR